VLGLSDGVTRARTPSGSAIIVGYDAAPEPI
jgi:hypothetical protein